MSREQIRQQAFQRQQQQASQSRQQRQQQRKTGGHKSAIAGSRTTGNQVEATFPDGGKANADLTFNASYQPGGTYPVSQTASGKTYMHNRSHVEPIADDTDITAAAIPVRWLLVTTTATDLIVRIGGTDPDPEVILTLPFDAQTRIVARGTSVFFGAKDLYFSFHLSLTGTGDDDWILSYGKASIAAPVTLTAGYTYFDDINITLYRLNGGSVEPDIVDTYTLTGQAVFISTNQSFFYYINSQTFQPVGYGYWLRELIDSAVIPETEGNTVPDYDYSNTSEILIWEGDTYTADHYFDYDYPSGDYTCLGQKIIRPGVTDDQTLSKSSGIESGIRYLVGYYSLYSSDGNISVGFGSVDSILNSYLYSSGITNTFVDPLQILNVENYIPYPSGVFSVLGEDGYFVDYWSSNDIKPVRIDRLNPDGSITESVENLEVYTFALPPEETIRPTYVNLSIFYFPD